MISDGTYEQFECALSTDRHFVLNPLVLTSCGHIACTACTQVCIKKYFCKICKKESDELSNEITSEVKKSFKENLDNFYAILEKQTLLSLNQLETEFKNKNEKIDAYIQHVSEEIEIRIESIRIELENLFDSFKNRLNDFKAKVKSDKTNNESEKYLVDSYKGELLELKNDVQKKINQNEEKFFEYQKRLQNLNKVVDQVKSKTPQIYFEPSCETINETLIGNILIMNDNFIMCAETLEKTINESNIEFVDTKHSSDICLGPNGHIICANRDSSCLSVYDEKINLIKTITSIDGELLSPTGVTTDGSQRIYFTNQKTHSIIMTDLDFNKIKSYGSKDEKKLNRPYGIEFFRNQVYACDSSNEAIQVLTDDLEHVKTIKVEYKPWKIRFSNSVAFVADGSSPRSYIYELENFNQKCMYEHGYAQLSLISPYFIEVASKRVLYVYDLDGNLLKEFKFNETIDYISNSGWDGCMVVKNNYLIITSDSSSKLIKLKLSNLLC